MSTWTNVHGTVQIFSSNLMLDEADREEQQEIKKELENILGAKWEYGDAFPDNSAPYGSEGSLSYLIDDELHITIKGNLRDFSHRKFYRIQDWLQKVVDFVGSKEGLHIDSISVTCTSSEFGFLNHTHFISKPISYKIYKGCKYTVVRIDYRIEDE